MRDKISQGVVNTGGFARGCSLNNVLMQLRELIRKRSDDGHSLVLVAGDILTAFDEMRHEANDQTMGGFGTDINVRIEMIKAIF